MYMILVNIFLFLFGRKASVEAESRFHIKLVLTDVIFGYQNGNCNYDVLKRLIFISKLCINKFEYGDYNTI